MTGPRLTRVLATSALATTLAGSIVTPSQAMPLPVTSVQEIAGTAPTEQVQWWRGRGWGGYGWGGGWGWRRPYYGGGGALAAGLIGGLALGALAASASSYYGYGYPSYGHGYPYSGYGFGYYPSSCAYPGYYGTSYYGTSYGLGYGSAYWASGKRVHKHGRKHGRR